MTTVYVAHPIDQAREHEDLPGQLISVSEWLSHQSFNSYWPRAGWRFAGDFDPSIIATVNHAAQRAADATLAYLPDGIATLGTPAEIERAVGWGQPTLILCGDETYLSTQVAEWKSEGARVYRFATLRGLLWTLDPRDRGSERWVRVVLEGGKLPTRHYDGDAGFDLHATEAATIEPGEYHNVPTDIRVGFPPGVWGMLVGRSSTAKKGLVVNQAIIDQGYTGPMWFGCTNVSNGPVRVEVGERLAQIIPMPLLANQYPVVEVEELPVTDRGESGFGSSG